MNRIPINFFCIGAQKAGTTTLYDILKQHPDIFLPEDKEAPFFAYSDWYMKGFDWFLDNHFKRYKNEIIAGTITPEYSLFPDTPKRIYEEIGNNIKFIFILRQPIDRAISHYNMSKGRLYENLSFEDAIINEKIRIKKGEFELNHFSYFTRGHYLDQIKRYLEFFPIENFLFLDFNMHVVERAEMTTKMILNFLEVEFLPLNSSIHSNKSFKFKSNYITRYLMDPKRDTKSWKQFIPSKFKTVLKRNILEFQKMENKSKFILTPEQSRKYFNEYFEEDFEELQSITKLNLNHWRL